MSRCASWTARYRSAEPTPISGRGITAPSVNCPSSYLYGSCAAPSNIATAATEKAAGILAALIGMKQHLLRFAPLSVGHIQRLNDQLRIWLDGNRPADHSPCMQIQHRRQVMPTSLRPDVGDVATPHLVGSFGAELKVQPVRDIWPLNRSLLVHVRAGLFADQAQLAHQPPHAKAANAYAILTQHAQDAATAR